MFVLQDRQIAGSWSRYQGHKDKGFGRTFRVMGIRTGHNTEPFWALRRLGLVVSVSGSSRDFLWRQMVVGGEAVTVVNPWVQVRPTWRASPKTQGPLDIYAWASKLHAPFPFKEASICSSRCYGTWVGHNCVDQGVIPSSGANVWKRRWRYIKCFGVCE